MMTPKLIISYLLAIAIVSIECSEQGGDAAAAASAAAGALAGAAAGASSASDASSNSNGGFNFGNMDGVMKTFTDGQTALQGWMESFSGTKVNNVEGRSEGNGLNFNNPMEFFQMMMDPARFMDAIATTFGLDKKKFNKAVARGMDFGMETMLQPPMECVKIMEKVFVPDACQLKFICDMGTQLAMFKGQMPKLPDSYFTGARSAKAMFDGATGRECQTVYACRPGEGPKLKKEFAGLKHKLGTGGGEGDSNEFAASEQSRVLARMGRAVGSFWPRI